MLINAYCTARELPVLDFPHRLLGSRDRSDAGLSSHIQGFLDYLSPTTAMTSERYALLRHIQRTAHHLSLEIGDENTPALEHWLAQARGVIFLPDGTVRDAQGRRLFHPEEPSDPDARLPVSEKALRRRAFNQRRLQSEGVSVPDTLPTLPDEEEIDTRSAQEVALRALALFLVALRAESLSTNEPIPSSEMKERQPLGFAALSPSEREFMSLSRPGQQSIVELSWRYEALQTLLWALGRTELPPAREIADVSALVEMMVEAEEEEIVANAHLRQSSILLDALDLHFRYHWAVRQASLEKREPPGDLIPGVVLERHYALNWLTRFESADWDDVDTPT